MTTIDVPYPSAPFELGEVALARGDDGVTCVCGNSDSDGLSAADRTGRYASILSDSIPRPAELGEFPLHEPPFAICNRCGRVYDDGDLDPERSTDAPVLARIDLGSAEAAAALATYLRFNFGDSDRRAI